MPLSTFCLKPITVKLFYLLLYKLLYRTTKCDVNSMNERSSSYIKPWQKDRKVYFAFIQWKENT